MNFIKYSAFILGAVIAIAGYPDAANVMLLISIAAFMDQDFASLRLAKG